MSIEFENGLYRQHEVKPKAHRQANLRWFQQVWETLEVGGSLITDAGTYIKTAKGFRRPEVSVGGKKVIIIANLLNL